MGARGGMEGESLDDCAYVDSGLDVVEEEHGFVPRVVADGEEGGGGGAWAKSSRTAMVAPAHGRKRGRMLESLG